MTRIRFRVNVTQSHIDEGACRLASKCMERNAQEDALRREFSHQTTPFRVRIDGGSVCFNAEGYRWKGFTHRVAKAALIAYDKWGRDRHKGIACPVAPHSYWQEAERMNRIKRNSPERTKQINDARKKRKNEGRPDKKYTLHRRVVGLA